jgi:hypothetical protein
VVAVEAIKVSAAVAFQAGELLLLGVVQAANAGAQELAQTGNPVAAVEAAATQAADVVNVASTIVKASVATAATNIRSAATQDLPTTHSTRLPGATPNVRNPVKPMAVRTGIAQLNRVVKSVTGSLSGPKSLHPNKSDSVSADKGKHAR